MVVCLGGLFLGILGGSHEGGHPKLRLVPETGGGGGRCGRMLISAGSHSRVDPERIAQSFQVAFDAGNAVFELVVLADVEADFFGFFVEVEQELAIPYVVQNVFLHKKINARIGQDRFHQKVPPVSRIGS